MNQQSQSKRERLRPQSRRSRRAKTTAKKQINLSCNKVTQSSLKDRKSYHSRRNSRIKKFVKIGAADVKKRKISADRSSKPVTIDSDDETTFYTFPSSSNRTTIWNNRYKIHKRREQRPSISNSRLSRRKPGPKVRDQYQTKGKQPLQELRVPVLAPLIESLSLTHPRLASAKNLNGRPVDRIPISQYKKSPQSSLTSNHAGRSFPIGKTVARRLTEPLQHSPHQNTSYDFTSAGGDNRIAMQLLDSPTVSERRQSARHMQSTYKYQDIVVKKYLHFTQVILNTTVGPQKNVLTIQALRELTAVLNQTKYDDTARVVLITGSDNGTFCSGLDLTYLTTGDIHMAARNMSDTLMEFARAALSFPKPLVAAVNGQTIGCGVGLLPLCDVVYASDKATFFTPYMQLGQVPDAGLSCSLSQVIGIALANEMLMAGRILTALEAYQMGLVAQVFWPTSFMQEVIPRIANMATACSGRILNATKSLVQSQHRERILTACHSEASMQTEIWCTPECQKSMKAFLEHDASL
ncbi:enoyl-CoA delta isomerase 3, peroxisomal-like [Watersipora subatra]|uniref:enoyl-CoA delta isomerase 3, peroxisomal-like n=1 Tax=Watersipora subatra TaxID=2589382 RepID=UPI00355AEA95